MPVATRPRQVPVAPVPAVRRPASTAGRAPVLIGCRSGPSRLGIAAPRTPARAAPVAARARRAPASRCSPPSRPSSVRSRCGRSRVRRSPSSSPRSARSSRSPRSSTRGGSRGACVAVHSAIARRSSANSTSRSTSGTPANGRRHGGEHRLARQLVDSAFAPVWRDGTLPLIVLGRGTASSMLRVDGTPVDAADRALLERAARLDDAPVLTDAEGGIGFVGAAAARPGGGACAVLVQVANHALPGALERRAAGWRRRGNGRPRCRTGRRRRALRVARAGRQGNRSVASVARGCPRPPLERRRSVAVATHGGDAATRAPHGRATARARRRATSCTDRAALPSGRSSPICSARPRRSNGPLEAARAAARAGLAASERTPRPRDARRARSSPSIPPGSRSTLAAVVGLVPGAAARDRPRTRRSACARRGHDRQRQERVPARVAHRPRAGPSRPTASRSSSSTSRAARHSSRSAPCRT